MSLRDICWSLDSKFNFDIYDEMRTLAEVIREKS